MKNKLRLYYDKEGDFLEIFVGKPTKCYASELGNGVFIRIDEKSKEVKSIGILNFTKQTKETGLDIPVDVNFSPVSS